MTAPPPPTSELALVIDVGSAWAKAGVIGRVQGRWRLVAHASQPVAWAPRELRRTLVDQLVATGDPRLAERHDELIGAANRIECHTARQLGRLAVVAVSREISGGTARRAAESAGWEVPLLVTLDDGRTLADRLAALQSAEVDAWLVVGGFDEGRTPRGIEAAALVAAARPTSGGPVVWAGSSRLADEVVSIFGADVATAVANPRPDARREESGPLRDHLRALLRERVAPEDEAHLVTAALPRAVSALARLGALRTLAVDIGARGAIGVLAEADGTVVVQARSDGGLGGAASVPGMAARIARLAPDAGDEAAVADLLANLRARPATLAQGSDELIGMQCAARLQAAELVRDFVDEPLDLVIGAGRTIAAAPRPPDALRILLDGVRPLGVTQFAVDAASLLGPLGSIADDGELREGLVLLADDLLVPLGTAVVSRGGAPGQVAMRVTVHRAGWPTPAPITVRVGQLQAIALPAGQEAELVIEPGPGISLGTGRRAARIEARATGGAVGLVLDGRGSPIGLPRRADDRRAVLAGWRDALVRESERSA